MWCSSDGWKRGKLSNWRSGWWEFTGCMCILYVYSFCEIVTSTSDIVSSNHSHISQRMHNNAVVFQSKHLSYMKSCRNEIEYKVAHSMCMFDVFSLLESERDAVGSGCTMEMKHFIWFQISFCGQLSDVIALSYDTHIVVHISCTNTLQACQFYG